MKKVPKIKNGKIHKSELTKIGCDWSKCIKQGCKSNTGQLKYIIASGAAVIAQLTAPGEALPAEARGEL